MVRRRRRKNPLLTRILVGVVIAHAIAIPVAAHFGALQSIEKDFGTSKVVLVRVPPMKKAAAAKRKKPKQASPKTRKGPSTKHASSAQKQHFTNAPKVVAAPSKGGSGGNALAVNNNGTGQAGQIPTAAPPPKKPTPAPSPPAAKPVATPTAAPPVPKPSPVVATPKKAAPVVPRFVQVEPIYQPQPVIPDDLRTEPLDKMLIVEGDLDTSGALTNVKIASSTGNAELDRVGLDTARRWKFSPATLGGAAVQGHVRFHIEFKVQ